MDWFEATDFADFEDRLDLADACCAVGILCCEGFFFDFDLLPPGRRAEPPRGVFIAAYVRNPPKPV